MFLYMLFSSHLVTNECSNNLLPARQLIIGFKDIKEKIQTVVGLRILTRFEVKPKLIWSRNFRSYSKKNKIKLGAWEPNGISVLFS